ncbi:MAG: rubrerythrin family protein [Nitrososphaerota archaeon]|jgi:rubrerythrin|nr:rubrerythrin family protein [Nitrososphaerota archaeon]MDG6927878.1 rubrerythrin family protein [Nitrososphaerota archaeon]MDG6931023.1 rubrerythrin family protein [Nitrososphaerota archaeon]MDG6932117.1 rubrerythrin family protein [Nitrososphaerota archaeon]MDG6936672.1 rubrerythrin family protein [Nitrososphaerota archaeon]
MTEEDMTMTQDSLASAYGGESMASMRYSIFADIAEKEGYKNVARLFRAISFAEKVHARNHFQRLSKYKNGVKVVAEAPFGPGDTKKNLELAIMGEKFEVEQMYPAYLELAKMQGDKAAETSFKYALEAEKIHLALYTRALEYVSRGEDLPVNGSVWICPVCGYTLMASEPPANCPVCNTSGKTFQKF